MITRLAATTEMGSIFSLEKKCKKALDGGPSEDSTLRRMIRENPRVVARTALCIPIRGEDGRVKYKCSEELCEHHLSRILPLAFPRSENGKTFFEELRSLLTTNVVEKYVDVLSSSGCPDVLFGPEGLAESLVKRRGDAFVKCIGENYKLSNTPSFKRYFDIYFADLKDLKDLKDLEGTDGYVLEKILKMIGKCDYYEMSETKRNLAQYVHLFEDSSPRLFHFFVQACDQFQLDEITKAQGGWLKRRRSFSPKSYRLASKFIDTTGGVWTHKKGWLVSVCIYGDATDGTTFNDAKELPQKLVDMIDVLDDGAKHELLRILTSYKNECRRNRRGSEEENA